MAHARAVSVGKRQADRSSRGPVVLGDTVELAPDVLGGGSHIGQDPRDDLVFQILVQHVWLRSSRPDRRKPFGNGHPAGLKLHSMGHGTIPEAVLVTAGCI